MKASCDLELFNILNKICIWSGWDKGNQDRVAFTHVDELCLKKKREVIQELPEQASRKNKEQTTTVF